jgi:hypothetical protein
VSESDVALEETAALAARQQLHLGLASWAIETVVCRTMESIESCRFMVAADS